RYFHVTGVQTCALPIWLVLARRRPALYPGPRCFTHHRVATQRRKERIHELAIIKAFEIDREDYLAIYEFQGGKCYVCQVANGKRSEERRVGKSRRSRPR